MSTCKDVHEFLMRYVEGELSDDERKVFEDHLSICPSCIDYMDSYKTCVDLGKSYKECCDEEAPKEMPSFLMDAILKAKKAVDEGASES